MPPGQSKAQSVILTASFTAVAALGALYGAGLKTTREIKQEEETHQEATTAERIALLEQRKGGLVTRRIGLQKKIDEVQSRIAQREVEMRDLEVSK